MRAGQMRRQARRMRRYGVEPIVIINAGDHFPEMVATVVARSLWRYRSELAPFILALALCAAATVLHIAYPEWWPSLLILATLTASALAGMGHRIGLSRASERIYATTVTMAAGTWTAAATALSATYGRLPQILLFGTLILGVPWWSHRRRRTKVRVSRTLAAWPELAERIGLPGSRIMSAKVDGWGWTARLALRRGQTATEAIGRLPAIESALGTRPGAVRIEPDISRANHLVMRVLSGDPHARPIKWERPGVTSITQPLPLGLFEDAEPVRVSLLRRHGLIGGVVGSGKSGVLNVILAALVGCSDVVIWGIDLKGGMELAPWESCLGRLATTPEEATALLADAVAELDARARDLRIRGMRLWEPTRERPALVIIIDEYAELAESAPDAVTCADSIARRGRATAVTLLAATQRPTQRAMGHGATRSQMDLRICLRVRERGDVDLILGQGHHATGWHAHTLDGPGKFLISDPEHTTPRRARAYLIDDRAVMATAVSSASERPTLPGWTSGLDGRPREAQNGSESLSSAETAEGALPPGADTQTPEGRLWGALRRAPDDGTPTAILIKITGKSRRWVNYRLNEHATAGRAVQVARGRWRALPPHRDHDV